MIISKESQALFLVKGSIRHYSLSVSRPEAVITLLCSWVPDEFRHYLKIWSGNSFKQSVFWERRPTCIRLCPGQTTADVLGHGHVSHACNKAYNNYLCSISGIIRFRNIIWIFLIDSRRLLFALVVGFSLWSLLICYAVSSPHLYYT